MISKNNDMIYREVQRPRKLWLWAVMLLTGGFFWYIFIQQIIFGTPVGDKPAPAPILIIFWVIFGIIFPAVMLGLLKLITEVRSDGIYIRFSPLQRGFRKISAEDIESFEPVDYSIIQYGGIGARISPKGERIYNLNGKKAVKLKLNKEVVVVSTGKQRDLLQAIETVKESDV